MHSTQCTWQENNTISYFYTCLLLFWEALRHRLEKYTLSGEALVQLQTLKEEKTFYNLDNSCLKKSVIEKTDPEINKNIVTL